MRLGRLFIFRVCAFTILTLIVAALMRNRGVVRRVEAALARVPEGKPWFLFLHAYDPHTHYKPRKNHFARRVKAIDRQAEGEGYCEFEDLPDGSRRLDPARIPRDPAHRPRSLIDR